MSSWINRENITKWWKTNKYPIYYHFRAKQRQIITFEKRTCGWVNRAYTSNATAGRELTGRCRCRCWRWGRRCRTGCRGRRRRTRLQTASGTRSGTLRWPRCGQRGVRRLGGGSETKGWFLGPFSLFACIKNRKHPKVNVVTPPLIEIIPLPVQNDTSLQTWSWSFIWLLDVLMWYPDLISLIIVARVKTQL